MPDLVPKGLLEAVNNKTDILSVPIEDDFFNSNSTGRKTISKNGRTVQILWNHRWEFDKQPEVFFAALRRLKKSGVKFGLHVVGQVFRQSPDCFETAKIEFESQIETWGYQQRAKYQEVLVGADIVVSTAWHDFQGLSMLEAMASGCIPIAPNRVAYPEYISKEQLYRTDVPTGTESHQLFDKLKQTIDRIKNDFLTGTTKASQLAHNCGVSPEIKLSHYSEIFLVDRYRSEIGQLISLNKNSG